MSTSRAFLAFASLMILLICSATAQAQGTFTNPIVTGEADPFISYTDGNYFLLSTDMHDSITVRKSPSLSTLGTAAAVTVYDTGKFYESAEIFQFSHKWYIYYTHYPNTVEVIESDTDNPQGSYHAKATLTTNTYDADVLEMPNGNLYLLGSTYGTLVIEPMSNPYTVSGPQSVLAKVDQPWENNVIEAPNTLWHEGQLFILYSSGGYNRANYAVGALRYEGGEVTSAASWKKLPGPLFTEDSTAGVFDAGVASAFLSPNGAQTWFVYSDYNAADPHQGTRTILAQQLSFDTQGNPVLGVPIAPGQAIPLPAGDPGAGRPPVGRTIILKTNSGKWVSTINTHSSVSADSKASGLKAQYVVVNAGHGYIALRSRADNHYLGARTAHSAVMAKASRILPDGTFQWINLGGGQIALKSVANQLCLSAPATKGSAMRADSQTVSPSETFVVTVMPLHNPHHHKARSANHPHSRPARPIVIERTFTPSARHWYAVTHHSAKKHAPKSRKKHSRA